MPLAAVLVVSLTSTAVAFTALPAAATATTASLDAPDQDAFDNGGVVVEDITTDGDAALLIVEGGAASPGATVIGETQAIDDVSGETRFIDTPGLTTAGEYTVVIVPQSELSADSRRSGAATLSQNTSDAVIASATTNLVRAGTTASDVTVNDDSLDAVTLPAGTDALGELANPSTPDEFFLSVRDPSSSGGPITTTRVSDTSTNGDVTVDLSGAGLSASDSPVTLETQVRFSDDGAAGRAVPIASPDGTLDTTVTSTFDVTIEDADAFTGGDPTATSPPRVEYISQGASTYAGDTVFVRGADITTDREYTLRRVETFDLGTVDETAYAEAPSVYAPSEYTSTDVVSDAELELIADQSDAVSSPSDVGALLVIETTDRDRDHYFIEDSDGVLPSEGQLDRSGTFELTGQSLTASLDTSDTPVLNEDVMDGTAELDVSSDRRRYTVNVTADGALTRDELFDIFTFNAVYSPDTPDHVAPSLPARLDGVLVAIARDGTITYTVDGGETRTTTSMTELITDPGTPVSMTDFTVTTTGDTTTSITPVDGSTSASLSDFNVQVYASDVADADEKILLRDTRDTTGDLSGIGISDGEYDVSFEAYGTDTMDTITFPVNDQDASVSFAESVNTQAAGDVVRVDVTLTDTDETYMQFGSEATNFIDIFYVEDDDDDGDVTFFINTRTLGTSAENVVSAPDDTVLSFTSERGFDDDTVNLPLPRFVNGDGDEVSSDDFPATGPDTGAPTEEYQQFSAYLAAAGVLSDASQHPSQQLIRPLQPADYPLITTTTNVFYASDGETSLADRAGFSTIDLTEPALGDATILSGPEEDADDKPTASELVDDSPLTETSTVTENDLLVVKFEATGIYGYLAHHDGYDIVNPNEDAFVDGDTFTALLNDDGEGVEFTFEPANDIGNQDGAGLRTSLASSSTVAILADNDDGALYIIADTSTTPFTTELSDSKTQFTTGLEYTAPDDTFVFSPGDGLESGPFGGADSDSDDAAYPYLSTGERETTSTTFTYSQRTVTMDNTTADGTVELRADGTATLSGTTPVSPGSDLVMRVRDAGTTDTFMKTTPVELTDNGTFTHSFNFNKSTGDQARITFRVDGELVSEHPAVFTDSPGNSSPPGSGSQPGTGAGTGAGTGTGSQSNGAGQSQATPTGETQYDPESPDRGGEPTPAPLPVTTPTSDSNTSSPTPSTSSPESPTTPAPTDSGLLNGPLGSILELLAAAVIGGVVAVGVVSARDS